ncbi:ABC transporter permease [Candidatus Aerophobetes bacterium]|nr:ABC transporter permease [Candidatus Aerophobetes bacterium]
MKFRIRLNIKGIIGLTIILVEVFFACFPSLIVFHNPHEMNYSAIFLGPSREHLLGTDEVGRDIFSLLIFGTRASLMVGFIAVGISTTVGSIVGLLSGYYKGIISEVLMRFTDLFLAIPRLPLMLVLVALVGQSIWNIIIVIGLLLWSQVARIVRSQTLSIREKSFIERGKAFGYSDFRIIIFHILPNVLPLVFANAILLMGSAIYYEVTVSFLGLGDPTHISWGMSLHYAFESSAILYRAYWYIIPPGVAIVITVLAFTLIGNALDESFNPKLRER